MRCKIGNKKLIDIMLCNEILLNYIFYYTKCIELKD